MRLFFALISGHRPGNGETMTIGERIKDCRKQLGLSQEDLAEKLYMKKTTICRYEKDQHDIPSSVLTELARVLNTTPNYLLLGELLAEDWMEEAIEALSNIKDPAMRKLAIKQLKCMAE